MSVRAIAQLVPRPVLLALLSLAVVLLVAPADSSPALAQYGFWISMFDGKPSSPQPYNPNTWDIQVHSRNRDTWTQLEPIAAHHGNDCAGHPATHQVTAYDQAVFQCNDHIMTAINASGYGLIVLTPDRMVDFGGGEAVVRFDMSTFRSSTRDWVSIWLSPWDDQVPLPLTDWLPDGTGEPRRAIHLSMDTSMGESTFRGYVLRNFQVNEVTTDNWTTIESLLTPSAVRRDVFELRVSRTSLKFGMPAYDRWWVNTTFTDLGWDRAVLQLAHHSYSPYKDCGTAAGCGPNTWHWDNVSISQAVPFIMKKADLPYLDETTRPWVSFQGPAPASSFLRFAGIGSNLQVSFDSGRTWQNAPVHPVEQAPEDHFKPYWMPVPTGTTRVDFRGSDWYGGGWMARGIAIWSQTVPLPPLPPPSSNCSTRPRTAIQTQAIGGGRLQVSVLVGRPATAPSNIVRQVRIVKAPDAQVQILGQTFGAAGGTVAPTTPSQSLTFTVARQPATAQVPVTVPFVVTDDCGEWNTFVGGGPNAF